MHLRCNRRIGRLYNSRKSGDLYLRDDYNSKDSYIMTINLPVVSFRIGDFAIVTFPEGASAIMQQSRLGEQQRLFTITNVTRVNSAIRSYCSCKLVGRFIDCNVAAGSRSPYLAERKRQTWFPFIYFHCHFTDCQDSPPFLPLATSMDVTIFAIPSHPNSWIYFNH